MYFASLDVILPGRENSQNIGSFILNLLLFEAITLDLDLQSLSEYPCSETLIQGGVSVTWVGGSYVFQVRKKKKSQHV